MRVTFGYLRLAPKPYDGNVTVTGGRVRKLELWRGMQQDSAGADSWKLAVRRMPFENQPDRPNPVGSGSGATQNIVPAGLIVTVDPGATSANFKTTQGNFTVPLGEVMYGRMLRYLDGDVVVERTPGPVKISESGEQHDYPSLAVTRSGAVWTAWQAYQDSGDHVYARQPGGPIMRLTGQKGDVFRTSVGEDASGRIHVAWSERQGADWNLYERVWDGSNWGPRRQITSANGPNIYHKLISGLAGPTAPGLGGA